MFANAVGENTFKKALTKYLTDKYALDNRCVA